MTKYDIPILQDILKKKAKQYRLTKMLITYPAKQRGWSTKTYLEYTIKPIYPEQWVEKLEEEAYVPQEGRARITFLARVASFKDSWANVLEERGITK